MNREVVEACADREAAARRIYQDAVTTAGLAKRKARDALFLLRDGQFTKLRDQIADLRRKRPRTEKTQAKIDTLGARLAAFKANPIPVDTSAIDAAYDEATTEAGNTLAATLRQIFYDRLHGVSP
jgi:hypothetical protein